MAKGEWREKPAYEPLKRPKWYQEALALNLLRRSRDDERLNGWAVIWDDSYVNEDGQPEIERLADVAGVKITYAHYDLTKLTTELREYDGRKGDGDGGKS